MPVPSITRRLEFDAGHRVLGHEGKCASLHGHRYVVEVTASAPDLDGLGRVIDFSIIKERVGGWIDSFLDHNLLLHPADQMVCQAGLIGREPFIMPYDAPNPTAENIAAVIFARACGRLPELTVERVRVYETPNCWADHVADD